MSPFPVALCGKNPNLASSFVEMMNHGDEFRVVTVFNTTAQATSELPSLLSSSSPSINKPISGLGSNASATSSIAPKAIVVGAGFSSDELETMRQGISGVTGAETLAWFTPAKTQPQRPGQSGFMEGVVGRAKDALRERIGADGEVEAGLHGF